MFMIREQVLAHTVALAGASAAYHQASGEDAVEMCIARHVVICHVFGVCKPCRVLECHAKRTARLQWQLCVGVTHEFSQISKANIVLQVVHNPNAVGGCGCGSSFAPK